MTISSENRKAGPYIGDGSRTQFPFAFKVFSKNDLLIVTTDSDGIETEIPSAECGVVINPDQDTNPGGSVTLNFALAAGVSLVITSAVKALQPVKVTNQGGFYPRVLNDAFDRMTIMIQQLKEQVGRSLKIGVGSATSGQFPATRPNTVLGFSSDGGEMVLYPLEDFGSGSGALLRADLSDPSSRRGAQLVGYQPGKTVSGALNDHAGILANIEANINFTTLPTAATPTGGGDLVLLRQGPENKKLPLSVFRAEVAVDAVAAKTAAEAASASAVTARDAAFVNAAVYASTSAGLAATTNGQQFQIVVGDEIIRYRRDDASTAVEVARYPSSKFVIEDYWNSMIRFAGYKTLGIASAGILNGAQYWNGTAVSAAPTAGISIPIGQTGESSYVRWDWEISSGILARLTGRTVRFFVDLRHSSTFSNSSCSWASQTNNSNNAQPPNIVSLSNNRAIVWWDHTFTGSEFKIGGYVQRASGAVASAFNVFASALCATPLDGGAFTDALRHEVPASVTTGDIRAAASTECAAFPGSSLRADGWGLTVPAGVDGTPGYLAYRVPFSVPAQTKIKLRLNLKTSGAIPAGMTISPSMNVFEANASWPPARTTTDCEVTQVGNSITLEFPYTADGAETQLRPVYQVGADSASGAFWMEYQSLEIAVVDAVGVAPLNVLLDLRQANAVEAAAKSNSATTSYSTTVLVVRTGGTVGTDCDFTSIHACLDSITDNSKTHRYIVQVRNGTYDISTLGRNYLGLKNYVEVVGQTRHGVRVIHRPATFSSSHAVFDPSYYGQPIEYARLHNMTLISYNGKAPFHADDAIWGGGQIVVDSCTLLNENPPAMLHAGVSVACGLSRYQKVRVLNCDGNGIMYAHNAPTEYDSEGCLFEIINCSMPWTQITDLMTYGPDWYRIENCVMEYIDYQFMSLFGPRSYFQQSIFAELSGNRVEYIKGQTDVAGYASDDPWGPAFGGKWGVIDRSIHEVVRSPVSTITKGGLVSRAASGHQDIEAWAPGKRLYGVALDSFSPTSEMGVVQFRGTVFLTANASTAIAFDDELQLNSSGQAVKRTTGSLIGYARESLASGAATIKVKLVG